MGQDNSRALEELPPHDPVAEWFLLCCLVHRPQLIKGIKPILFYIEECRRVILKMQQFLLEGRECVADPALFLHELGRALDTHYHEPLTRAFVQLPSPENWTYWLDILVAHWKARRLLQISPRISDASYQLQQGNSSPVESIRKELHEIDTESAGMSSGKKVGEMVRPVIDELEKQFSNQGVFPGLTTGLSNLDRATAGLQKGRFYIIAGRPGEGKSSMLLSLAAHVASLGKKVVYYSLEMPGEELTGRLISSMSRVVLGKFSRGTATQEDFERVSRASLEVKKLDLCIVDSMSGLQQIIHHAGVESARGLCDLIVVDYLQRIRIPGFRGNRNDLVTEISNAIKDIAMSANVPVLSAAQLNRSVTREDRHPNLSDLRDSGSLEQDADFVGLLHSENQNETRMLVAKNRSGDTGVITFTFRREITRFDSPV